MWCELRCPIGRRTLTQCPVRESTVSLQAPTAGWLSAPRPARADSCSFPSPCSPTVEPCAASTFPECRRWRNDPALTSQTPWCVRVFSLSSPLLPPHICPLALSSPRGAVCLSVARLHLSFVYVSHRLYFLQECPAGCKLRRCRVTALLYGKHPSTFPHP